MDTQPVEILKWIGIVLAAGFVGYFGRYLAMIILRQANRKETKTATSVISIDTSPPDKSHIKLAKKRDKQQAKQAKKSAKK